MRYLPIVLRERGFSLTQISSLAIFTFPELLKPFLAPLLDMRVLHSLSSRTAVILIVQFLLIALFCTFSSANDPKLYQLGVFFLLSSILTTVHDAAVDGLAVSTLLPSEQSLGAFGQYLGNKLGSLLAGGILPAVFGKDHRTFCLCLVVIMVGAVFLTLSYRMDLATLAIVDYVPPQNLVASNLTLSCVPYSQSEKELLPARSCSLPLNEGSLFRRIYQLLKRYLSTAGGMHLIAVLLGYKVAEHAMDAMWIPMLVDSGVSRKHILNTQMLLGNTAAVLGAALGSFVSSYCGNNHFLALAMCSSLRLLPESLQCAYSVWPRLHQLPVVALHAALENVAGSASSSAMFTLLLAESDATVAASSYAFLNGIAALGMKTGEVLSGHVSEALGYTWLCVGCLVFNALFPFLALSRPSST